MSFNLEAIRDRADLSRAIRGYFDDIGYLETETPLLTATAIPESHIELFRTDRILSKGGFLPLFLVPSPEVWLKLLLADGAPSLYQIGKCFRNGEQIDRWHRIEFTMLEWYGLNQTVESNLEIMQDILSYGIKAVNPAAPDDVGGEIRVVTMEQAFQDFAGFSLEVDLRESGIPETTPASLDFKQAQQTAAEIFCKRLKEHNLPVGEPGRESADDYFHRLFITLVEDKLPVDRPLALTQWPALIPTLARNIPGTPWAERWELYIRGVEVANCYGEETELNSLRAYWDSEAPKKAIAAVPTVSDPEWPEKIAMDMPVCSGAAVGLDRLLALIRGDADLKGLDLFPIRDIMPR